LPAASRRREPPPRQADPDGAARRCAPSDSRTNRSLPPRCRISREFAAIRAVAGTSNMHHLDSSLSMSLSSPQGPEGGEFVEVERVLPVFQEKKACRIGALCSFKVGDRDAMRGDEAAYGKLFRYISLKKQVRSDRPLRAIRGIADAALKSLAGKGTIAPTSPWGCASKRQPRIDPGKAANRHHARLPSDMMLNSRDDRFTWAIGDPDSLPAALRASKIGRQP
jgi:hypothetical protein